MARSRTSRRIVYTAVISSLLCCARLAGAQQLATESDAGTAPTATANWRLEQIALPDVPVHLSFGRRTELDYVLIETRAGAELDLDPCDDTFCPQPYRTDSPNRTPDGALPHSLVADAPDGSAGLIGSVWVADPVQRLGDGPLGPVSAGALIVRDQSNTLRRLDLPIDQGFVDLAPKLADFDGDKAPEIVVVKGQIGLGVSLLVVQLAADGFHIAAETPVNGGPGAWMKLAGIADFNGDSQLDLAVVTDPGPEGRLELFTYIRGYLQPLMTAADVSNHAPGLTVAEMSLAGDFDGDQVADLAIPSADRLQLRVISFRTGQPFDIQRISLPAAIVTEILAVPNEQGLPTLVMGLADSTLAIVGRPL
jgi:FG-GAP-like repeat